MYKDREKTHLHIDFLSFSTNNGYTSANTSNRSDLENQNWSIKFSSKDFLRLSISTMTALSFADYGQCRASATWTLDVSVESDDCRNGAEAWTSGGFTGYCCVCCTSNGDCTATTESVGQYAMRYILHLYLCK